MHIGRLMIVNKETGKLENNRFSPSPHFNERPDEGDVSLLVIHSISLPPGEFGGSYIEDFFLGKLDVTQHDYFKTLKETRVSAHLVIDRQGEIIQFVPFSQRAWHAGQSSFNGRDNCNDFSIGIELEGVDDVAYSDAQYKSLVEVTKALQAVYSKITNENIKGHEHIAPGRKTDPGPAFDWMRYLNLL
jgi:N-acetyl-anhydromuramoyl-L-alanine amidase